LKQILHIIRAAYIAFGICILMLGITSDINSQVVSQDSTQNLTEVSSKKNPKGKSRKKSQSKALDKRYRASYLGVLGGAGYYDAFFNPSYGTTGDISPVFGVSFRYESPLNKSIDIELRYRRSGWQNEGVYVRELSIIDLPVLAHISFGKKKTKAFFTLGETVTFIVSEKEEILDASSDPAFSEQAIDNKIGFALNLGVGVLKHFEKSAIQFEVRGTITLTNLYKPENELQLENSNAYFIEGVIKYLFRVK
jgi:outer membrane protein with beta-barrel domain